jgi:hypothetical protein
MGSPITPSTVTGSQTSTHRAIKKKGKAPSPPSDGSTLRKQADAGSNENLLTSSSKDDDSVTLRKDLAAPPEPVIPGLERLSLLPLRNPKDISAPPVPGKDDETITNAGRVSSSNKAKRSSNGNEVDQALSKDIIAPAHWLHSPSALIKGTCDYPTEVTGNFRVVTMRSFTPTHFQ